MILSSWIFFLPIHMPVFVWWVCLQILLRTNKYNCTNLWEQWSVIFLVWMINSLFTTINFLFWTISDTFILKEYLNRRQRFNMWQKMINELFKSDNFSKWARLNCYKLLWYCSDKVYRNNQFNESTSNITYCSSLL